MGKRENDKWLPDHDEDSSYLEDWWLDEEDSADDLPVFDPDEAEDYAKDRQRLTGVPIVTGYEALERHRGVRRPRRKLSRREQRAWEKAQKYEAKLHKAQEKEDKKRAKQEAKLAAREEKAAQKQAKKEKKYKKKTKPTASSSAKSSGKKCAAKKVSSNNNGGNGTMVGGRYVEGSWHSYTDEDGTSYFDDKGNAWDDKGNTWNYYEIWDEIGIEHWTYAVE